MTVYAITDTKKGRTGIAPTHLQTTHKIKFTVVSIVVWVRYLMNTKCAFKRCVKWTLDTKLLLQNFLYTKMF